jgi:hypothetical protein
MAAVAVVVAAVTAGCQGHVEAGPQQADDPPSSLATDLLDDGSPSFDGALPVDLASGLRVIGLGCRQSSPRDACSADGSRTYTWVGPMELVTVTSVRTHPDADHGAWVVAVRFASDDRRAVQASAERSAGMGGYALLLDQHNGNALQAAAPLDVEGGRITVRDMEKGDAWALVDTFVAAAATR